MRPVLIVVGACSPRSMIRLRVLLGSPFSGWVRGDSQDADAPCGVLYDGQDMGPGAVEQVGGEEVARQDRLGPGPQKLRPGKRGSARRRVDSWPS